MKNRPGNVVPILVMVFAVLAFSVLAYFGWHARSKVTVDAGNTHISTDASLGSNANVNTSVNENANVSANVNTTVNENTNISANVNTATDPTAGWKTYTNATFSYAIKYPSDWTVTQQFGTDQVQLLPPGVNKGYLGENALAGAVELTIHLGGDEITNPQTIMINGMEVIQGNQLGLVTFITTQFTKGAPRVYVRWSQRYTDPVYNQILNTFTFTDPTAGWKTYTNTAYGYSIKYPNDWIANASNPKSVVFSSEEKMASDSQAPGSPLYTFNIEAVSSTAEISTLQDKKIIVVDGVEATQGTKPGIPNVYVTIVQNNNIILRISWSSFTAPIYNQILSTLTFTQP